MHDLGVPHSKIAGVLDVSDDTVTNDLEPYRDEGIQGMLEGRSYQPVSSVETFLDEISASFAASPVATASEGGARIEEVTGINLSDSQVGRIMWRPGMRYQKSAAVPGKCDPRMQFDFLNEELLPRLEEAKNGERRVISVDAAYFVKGAFLGMVRAFARVFVRIGTWRQQYDLLGAVGTRDHDFVSVRTNGTGNAETICELIAKIDAAYPGEEIALIMDNARCQRNRKVAEIAESAGIEPLCLPAYSPYLNFIDSVSGENRHHMRSLVTENFQLFENPQN
jgi:hypothetical protein